MAGKSTAFVTPISVIGHQSGQVQYKPPLWLNDRQHIKIVEKRAKLDQWIELVAKPCRFSTRLMLIMSAAFAAPLLGQLSLQPFGINLFGPSKVGKTAALLAATSVIGIGREFDLPNWNRTNAAALEQARLFNDQFLGINEVGLLGGKRSDAYSTLRALIYRFSEGRDKSRHSSAELGPTTASASWRGIFVSTAEHSFSDYATFSGEVRDEGEFARCLDLPATTAGSPTIFDRRPKNMAVGEFSDWARTQLIALSHACEKNCGVAIGPYIEHLIDSRATLTENVNEWVNEFIEFG